VFYLLEPCRVLRRNPCAPPLGIITSLIGVFSGRIARAVFQLPSGAALAIACIVVCGPFFRYIIGAYYLSTLMSMPVLLYLVWMTVTGGSQDSQGSKGFLGFFDVGLAIRFGAAYILLLFLYPFLLLAAVAAQAAAIGLRFVADLQSTNQHRAAWREGRECGSND
jgi:hypothetical protein